MGIKFFHFLNTMLYPPRCPGCNGLLRPQQHWCHACKRKWGDGRRLQRQGNIRFLDAIYCVASYRGPVGKGLRDLKYGAHSGQDDPWRELLSSFPWTKRLQTYHGVVPVPLAWEKKEIRGFNQTEILFRSWARHMELPWLDILQRVRPTAGQYALTSQERYDNIKNAFAIKGNCASMVKGRHIIVVDDIYTTGATLDGCARVLKKHGAAMITGLVMASDAR